MTNPWILYCETEEEFWHRAEEDLLLCIQETLRKHGNCRLGLAGGSTPKKLYESLAEKDLPWDKITLVLLDERYVPSDHSESNLGMLRKSFLTRAPLPPDKLIAFDTSLPYESAAEEMDRKLMQLDHPGRPLLDCLILGAGSDGHIASLFEGDDAIQSAAYASTAHASGYPTPQRLTLTLRALEGTPSALLLLKGAEKLPVLEAFEGKRTDPPLTALRALSKHTLIKILAYLQN